MGSDIQFGEVQHAEPNRGVRPDRDAQFCVMAVGDLASMLDPRRQPKERQSRNQRGDKAFHIDDDGDAFNDDDANNDGLEQQSSDPQTPSSKPNLSDDELMIFVDLDVMRDMESHAASNTKVELGGVLLGYQKVDDEGVPFVVVTECLRAEHYEATKGSFKFTHDTWSQITDERARFHPELEMIGWYHTHPGWSVFLSGMDLFICNNFFNRMLDVALVIDPVAHERGWFQWTVNGQQKKTRETRGFYLMSNRYREKELRYFAKLYSGGQTMNYDPRYSESNIAGGGQPIVNISDNRRPIFDLAVIAMLCMQFLFLSLIAWKMISPSSAPSNPLVASTNDAAFGEVIESIVERQTGEKNLVKKFADQKLANTRLEANLDGQMLRANKIARDFDQSQKRLAERTLELANAKEKSGDLESEIDGLKKQVVSLGGEVEADKFDWAWVYWTGFGVLAIAIGGVGGYLVAQKRDPYYDDDARHFDTEKRSETGVRPNADDRLSLGGREDEG